MFRLFPILAVIILCSWAVNSKELDALGRGKDIYEQYCTVCHGKHGEADTPLGRILQPPPRSLTDPVAMARINDARLREAIKDGKPGTSMPAWSRILSTSQIDDVAVYVKHLKRPRPAGMTQDDFDAAVGGTIYRSYCGICHGDTGNAKTTIGHVLIDKPRDFTDAMSMAKLTNEEMARAIAYGRPGTAMVFIRRQFVPVE